MSNEEKEKDEGGKEIRTKERQALLKGENYCAPGEQLSERNVTKEKKKIGCVY